MANGGQSGQIDLTTVGPSPGAGPASVASPVDIAYDPSRDREKAREQLALLLVFGLLGVVAFALISAAFAAISCYNQPGYCKDTTASLGMIKLIVELLFAPLIGLVGAATGFYFGEKSAGK